MHLVSYYMTKEHGESICVDEFSILLYDEMSISFIGLEQSCSVLDGHYHKEKFLDVLLQRQYGLHCSFSRQPLHVKESGTKYKHKFLVTAHGFLSLSINNLKKCDVYELARSVNK